MDSSDSGIGQSQVCDAIAAKMLVAALVVFVAAVLSLDEMAATADALVGCQYVKLLQILRERALVVAPRVSGTAVVVASSVAVELAAVVLVAAAVARPHSLQADDGLGRYLHLFRRRTCSCC